MFAHRFCGDDSAQAKLLRKAAASTKNAQAVEQDARVLRIGNIGKATRVRKCVEEQPRTGAEETWNEKPPG